VEKGSQRPSAADDRRKASREGDAAVQEHREDLTDRARHGHDALTAAIEELERALAAPAARRAKDWSGRVAGELDLVREAIRAHVEGVEESEGLFDEIRVGTPWLASRVAALKHEHAVLVARASALADRLPGNDAADYEALRREAAALLVDLRAHRAGEADLIYEAFWTDLGAVD
jgi:hypothetical protein